MERKNNRKGFTIVELVITIAVIGVLTAILVPTFIGLTQKANEASDDSLVTNLNKALAIHEVQPGDTKNVTPQDAIDDLYDEGYRAEVLATKSEKTLVWCDKDNRFHLATDTGVEKLPDGASEVDCWGFYTTMPEDQRFSIYAVGEWGDVEGLTVGFDAGLNEELTVTYSADVAKNVTIRTNSGILNIGSSTTPAPGRITHYGTLVHAEVYTTNSSFHTHGKIANMVLKAGKAVAEDKGYVALIRASDGTQVEEVDSGVFYIPSSVPATHVNSSVYTDLGYKVEGSELVIDSSTPEGQERAAAIQSTAYEIGNKFDLKAFRDSVNAGQDFSQIKVVMTDDIDMAGELWGTENNNVIGTSDRYFTGSFDGQGHTISNLSNGGAVTAEQFTSITSQTTGYIFGLFGYIGGTVSISNLTLENVLANIPNGLAVGGLISGPKAGKVCNLTVQNVTVTGMISAKEKTGGLIGYGANYNTAVGSSMTLIGCNNYANVTTTGDRAAGIASCDGGKGALTMTDCHNYGDISASTFAAGMVANLNKAQELSVGFVKNADQTWKDVITAPAYVYTNCTNEGVITVTDESGIKAELFLDKNIEPSAFNISDSDLNTTRIKRLILAYRNYVGSNVDWQAVDKYGILAGLAYDLNLSGEYAAVVADCHASTIGDAVNYQNHVDKNAVLTMNVDYANDLQVWGNINLNSHSISGRLSVKTAETLTLSNGTLSKLTINNNGARVTLVNMTVTGTSVGQSDLSDIYLQSDGVLSVVSGTYSFDPTTYLAEGSSAVENAGVWTVTAGN